MQFDEEADKEKYKIWHENYQKKLEEARLRLRQKEYEDARRREIANQSRAKDAKKKKRL